jgi:restriction endonuclease Mrr
MMADEGGWIITTSTFTPKARDLARSTHVRLIDGKELAERLEGLREHRSSRRSMHRSAWKGCSANFALRGF